MTNVGKFFNSVVNLGLPRARTKGGSCLSLPFTWSFFGISLLKVSFLDPAVCQGKSVSMTS